MVFGHSGMAHATSKCTWHYYLKGHKFVIWLGCPRIDFHRTLQSNDQKFDSFIFYWKQTWKKNAGQYQDGTLKFFWVFFKLYKYAFYWFIHPNRRQCCTRPSLTFSFPSSFLYHSGVPIVLDAVLDSTNALVTTNEYLP